MQGLRAIRAEHGLLPGHGDGEHVAEVADRVIAQEVLSTVLTCFRTGAAFSRLSM